MSECLTLDYGTILNYYGDVWEPLCCYTVPSQTYDDFVNSLTEYYNNSCPKDKVFSDYVTQLYNNCLSGGSSGSTSSGGTGVYVTGGTANGANSTLNFTNSTGGTFTVTNSALLFNDAFVTGGTLNQATGVVTFTNSSGGTFTVSGFDDFASYWSGSSDGTSITTSGSNTTTNVNLPGLLGVTGDTIINGDLFVTEYIKHKGDDNTAIRFTDNKISLDAGGMTFFAVHDDNSAPFTATINGGSNRINFRAMDRNNDILLKTDSEAFNVSLYHAGNKKLETTSTGINISGSTLNQGNLGVSGITYSNVVSANTQHIANTLGISGKTYLGSVDTATATASDKILVVQSTGEIESITTGALTAFTSDYWVGNGSGTGIKPSGTTTNVDVTGVLGVTGNSTFGGSILLGDGSVSANYAGFGNNADLKIFHNGSHSIVRETGTGSLYLQSDNNVIISKDSSTELMVKGIADGAVEIYYDNVKKFETTSAGVNVSGNTLIKNELGVSGRTYLGTIDAAGGSYSADKILVAQGDGEIEYLTTAELKADIADADYWTGNTDGTSITPSGGTTNTDIKLNGGLTAQTLSISGNTSLGDNDKIMLGADNDLEVYANSSGGRIAVGSSTLQVEGNTLDFTDGSATSYLFRGVASGAVSLYYSGTKKFETTSSGINVSGNTLVKNELGVSGKTYLGTIDAAGGSYSADKILVAQGDGEIEYLTTAELKADIGDNDYWTGNTDGTSITPSGGTTNTDIKLNGGLTAQTLNISGNTILVDDAKLMLGDANDLQIYHDGSNSIIQDNGTGHVQVRSGTFTILNAAGSKTSAIFNSGSEQAFYYDDAQKLETTSTGINVSGSTLNQGNLGVTGVTYSNIVSANTQHIASTLGVSGKTFLGSVDTATATASDKILVVQSTGEIESITTGALTAFTSDYWIGNGSGTGIKPSGGTVNVDVTGQLGVSGDTTINGNLYVSQYIKHNGDPNTYLEFYDDRLLFNIGGISYLDLNDASSAPHDIIFNNGNNDVDLTIKGGSSTILFTDASTHRVGIGTETPTVKLDVNGDVKISGETSIKTNLGVTGVTYSNIVSANTQHIASTLGISGRTFLGTVDAASPTPTSTDKILVVQSTGEIESITKAQLTGFTENYWSSNTDSLSISPSGSTNILLSGGTGTGYPLTIDREDNGHFLKFHSNSNPHQDYTFESESSGSFYGLNLKNKDGDTIVNFAANQMFGVGTINPTVAIDVDGGLSGADALQVRIAGRTGIGHSNAGQQRSIFGNSYGNDATRMGFTLGGYTTADEKITVMGTGNVGIGTATETIRARLHVSGSTILTDSLGVSGNTNINGVLSGVTDARFGGNLGVSGRTFLGSVDTATATASDKILVVQSTGEIESITTAALTGFTGPTYWEEDGTGTGIQTSGYSTTTVKIQKLNVAGGVIDYDHSSGAVKFGQDQSVIFNNDNGDVEFTVLGGGGGTTTNKVLQLDLVDGGHGATFFTNNGNTTNQTLVVNGIISGNTNARFNGVVGISGRTYLGTIDAAGGSYSNDKILVAQSNGEVEYLTTAQLKADIGDNDYWTGNTDGTSITPSGGTTNTDIKLNGGLTAQTLNVSGNTILGDNDKIMLGDANDLKIYHDGTDNHIESTGDLNIDTTGSGDIILDAVGEIKFETADGDIRGDASNYFFSSSVSGRPRFYLLNTNTDANGAEFVFDKTSVAGADGDDIGKIKWDAEDDAGTGPHTYGQILGEIAASAGGQAGGKLSLQIASHDGDLENGLILQEGNVDGEVDVTVGNGTNSITTITGNLKVTGDTFNKGNLGVTGNTYVKGNTFIDGTLSAMGNTTLTGTLDLNSVAAITPTPTSTEVILVKDTSGVVKSITKAQLTGITEGLYWEEDGTGTGIKPSGATTNIKLGGGLTAQTLNISGNTILGDNDKIMLGADNDLEIYSDSTNGRIAAGSGVLQIEADTLDFTDGAATEYYIRCVANGSVSLYHDANKKFETTPSGINISGNTLVKNELGVSGKTYLGDIGAAGGSYSADKILVAQGDGEIEYLTTAQLKADIGDNDYWVGNGSGTGVKPSGTTTNVDVTGVLGVSGKTNISGDLTTHDIFIDEGDKVYFDGTDGSPNTYINKNGTGLNLVVNGDQKLYLTPTTTTLLDNNVIIKGGNVNISGNTFNKGNLGVTGNTYVKGNTFIDGTLSAMGNTTLSGTLDLNSVAAITPTPTSTEVILVKDTAGVVKSITKAQLTGVTSDYWVGNGSGTGIKPSGGTVNVDVTGQLGVSGDTTISGDLFVAEYIKHAGDSDTFIQFADDSIGINAGNEQLITISESPTFVKIGDGGDVDFQVRTNSDDNTLYVEGSTDNVGIGTNTPTVKLDVNGSVRITGDTFTKGNLGVTGNTYVKGNTYIDGTLSAMGNTTITGDLDVDGTSNLDNTDIDGTLVVDGTNISLDSTSTLNIDNSNTTNGITIGTATSAVPISIGHTTSETTINDNLTVTGTLDLDSVAAITPTPTSTEVILVKDSSGVVKSITKAQLTGVTEGLYWVEDGVGTGIKPSGATTNITIGGDITANGNIIGDDNTDITNISTIKLDRIEHDGDDDTKITFTDDDINITVGNVNMLDFTEDTNNEITFNETGVDIDVRMEGNTDQNLFFLDAGNDKIAIGTDTVSSSLLTVDGSIQAGSAGFIVGNATLTSAELDISSGNFTLDVEGDITLDANGADIILSDDGTDFGRFKRDASHFIIKAEANNKDIIFRGQDAASTIDALLLDMSEAGSATFNRDVNVSGVTSGRTDARFGGDLSVTGRTFLGTVDTATATASDKILVVQSNGEIESITTAALTGFTSDYWVGNGTGTGIKPSGTTTNVDVIGQLGVSGETLFNGKVTGNGDFKIENLIVFETASTSANTYIGYQAGNPGQNTTQHQYNTAIGYQALYSQQGGQDVDGNTAIGYKSLYSITTGEWNTGIGESALRYTTTQNGNTAIGKSALGNSVATSGQFNVVVGYLAGYNVNGTGNLFFGIGTGAGNNSGSNTGGDNVGMGNYSVGGGSSAGVGTLTSGDRNLGVGSNALGNLTSGNDNIGIGSQAGDAITSGDFNIVIGPGQDVPSATGDYQMNIGGIIHGKDLQMSTGEIQISGNTILTNDLGVSGDTNINGTLSAMGNTTIGGTLDLDSVATTTPTPTSAERILVKQTSGVVESITKAQLTGLTDFSSVATYWQGNGSGTGIKPSGTTTNVDVTGVLGVSGKTNITGDLDVDGTSNLDAVDIDGNVQLDGTFTVGVDDTGYDVKFFGATSGKYMLWDEDQDSLDVKGVLNLEGGTTAAAPTPQLHFGNYYDSSGGPSISHIDLYNGDYGFGISVGDLDYISDIRHRFYSDTSAAADGTPALQIDGENNQVGVNMASASYSLDVTGDIRINSGALGVGVNPNGTDGRIDASNDVVAYSSSDKRWKENIQPIENALDKVSQISGVEFDWKKLTKEEKKTQHGNEGHDIGVIAQEIEKVLPEIVTTRENGYKGVRYEKIVPLLIESIKELKAEIEELKNK